MTPDPTRTGGKYFPSFLSPFLSFFHPFVCVYVCTVTQPHLTLCDPMDSSPPGSSVHGILQARVLEWVAMPSSRGIFPTQASNPSLLRWQAYSLPLASPVCLIIAY